MDVQEIYRDFAKAREEKKRIAQEEYERYHSFQIVNGKRLKPTWSGTVENVNHYYSEWRISTDYACMIKRSAVIKSKGYLFPPQSEVRRMQKSPEEMIEYMLARKNAVPATPYPTIVQFAGTAFVVIGDAVFNFRMFKFVQKVIEPDAYEVGDRVLWCYRGSELVAILQARADTTAEAMMNEIKKLEVV